MVRVARKASQVDTIRGNLALREKRNARDDNANEVSDNGLFT